MPVLKFDVSDSDPEAAREQREYPKPRPGVYLARVRGIKLEKPAGKDQRIECELEITDGEFKGWFRTLYVNVESEAAKWKLDQFLQAFDLANDKKRKGQFNTDTLLGKICKIRVKSAFYKPDGAEENVYSPEIGAVYSKNSDEALEEGGSGGGDEEDPHAGETGGGVDGDDEWTQFLGMDEDELAEHEDELREICAEYDIDPDTIDTWAEVVEQINDAKNGGGSEESSTADGTSDSTDEDEYDDEEVWGLSDLKAELKKRGLDQKGNRAAVVARLRESDASGPFGG